ncbi:MAG TPA: hypothetical protein VEY09_00340 [Pyrinomonadaceae bacterium]|nr:hypothetical protein [Pyrinomonadaceae bacterium]
MRKTLMTAALLLALSCPALAGEIGTPGVTAPPPQPARIVQEPTDAASAGGIMQNDAPDSLTQTLLDLLALLPALL